MSMLGKKFRDRITGFQGTCTGYVQYLTGCNQALLAPAIGADGTLRESAWFDVQRLEALDEPAVLLNNGATPGADRAPPKH